MKRVSLFLALLALGGCSVSSILAPSGDPAKLYTLSAPRTVATSAAPAHWQLLIAMPDAPLDINTIRIAIAPAPGRIDYYANVAWADRPPAMLQDLLLQSFDSSGRIAAVQRQTGGLKADFVLTSELRDFQVEAGVGDPAAHIHITLRLVRARDRTIVGMKDFDIAMPAGGNFDGAIAAFDSCLKSVLPQIVDWTLNQGNANQ
jgi:cholesterol transport system auxiliary component